MDTTTKAPQQLQSPRAGSASSDGYVGVADEPQHYHRFENDFVRVYDVRFAPGESSLYHRHDEDTLYVTVRDATIHDQTYQSDECQVHRIPAGLSLCRPHKGEPLIHRVRNDGTGPMQMIGAEVKKLPEIVAAEPLQAPFHTLLENLSGARRLRLYMIKLEPGETTGPVTYGFSGLTVSISDANVEFADATGVRRVISFAPGAHIWHDGPLTQTLTNRGETAFVAVLGEWC
ncbi:hypothetical protein GCM10011348_45310 [Marinobacterium nitratireducens]|uniref:Cupin domain-containing protein n=1 Tax=Marinobacterium nitratireducens TaxID=518897 RepID=A0A918DYX8_9GAMM|nr:hypothetical protein [Marinobacterium nitratireducens]GGO88870.1 hypothetical protein GCM10011348_45310 [Marinobacterium nitratireducens]